MPDYCAPPPLLTAITRTVTVAAGRFAPGHPGELTAIVPFELVDAILSETRTVQRRPHDPPSWVGAYFLPAMCLLPEVGYRLVWDKLTAGLSGMPVVRPSAKELRDLRRRIERTGAGVARGAGRAAGPADDARGAVRAVPDGVVRRLQFAESPRLRAEPGLAGEDFASWLSDAGVDDFTRALVGAVFGPTAEGATSYAGRLLHLLRPDMLVLWDKGFDSNAFLAKVTATGAQVLGRLRSNRRAP